MRAGASSGPLLVLNPDVELGEESVPRLLRYLQDEGVGIAVPQIRNADGTVFRSLRKEPAIHRVWAEAMLGDDLQPDSAFSRCLMSHRTTRCPKMSIGPQVP